MLPWCGGIHLECQYFHSGGRNKKSGVQDDPGLHRECKASMSGYRRPYHKVRNKWGVTVVEGIQGMVPGRFWTEERKVGVM